MARVGLILLALMLGGLQYQLWVGDGSLEQAHTLQQKLHSIRSANKKQKATNDALAARIKDLKSGTAGVQRLARSELGYVKSGETFYLTVPNGDKRTGAQARAASDQ